MMELSLQKGPHGMWGVGLVTWNPWTVVGFEFAGQESRAEDAKGGALEAGEGGPVELGWEWLPVGEGWAVEKR